jgi:GntR family transcriptional regulator/MocR family aminotransferase
MEDNWASSLDLLVDLDRAGGVRQGIETAIRQAIHDGRLRLGARLPSTRALARDLDVARGTITEAYGQLAIVAMEDPCPPRYRSMVGRAGLDVVPVPCDGDGLRIASLRELPVDAVVLTPAHQFPLGVTLSARRRSSIVEWARANDAYIIEDDYDGEFRFDRRAVGALQQMDPDRVIYVGTASKTLAPGLRLGWLTLPGALREALIRVKDRLDRGNGVLDQLVLADLITSGEFDRHIRRMRGEYRRRRDDLLRALTDHTPELEGTGISAGMHLLLPLPSGAMERHVLAEAAKRTLLLHRLAEYWHRPDPGHPHALIIGYGTPAAHAFRPAIDQLVSTLSTAFTAHPASGSETSGPGTSAASPP